MQNAKCKMQNAKCRIRSCRAGVYLPPFLGSFREGAVERMRDWGRVRKDEICAMFWLTQSPSVFCYAKSSSLSEGALCFWQMRLSSQGAFDMTEPRWNEFALRILEMTFGLEMIALRSWNACGMKKKRYFRRAVGLLPPIFPSPQGKVSAQLTDEVVVI